MPEICDPNVVQSGLFDDFIVKKCCLTKGHTTCIDCEEYSRYEIFKLFFDHPGYKYPKYKQALKFIRAHDDAAFPKAAEHWKNAYSQYLEQDR
ncbi:hypothetical protein I4200191B4_15810 [Pseudoflavonifractor gallinarum]